MEDLTSWVTREAQDIGIDFACLSPQTRNNIISILMSGLENGFRSRMDSPDLRFAKRRGIGEQNQPQSMTSSSLGNPNTTPATDSSCPFPDNDDQTNCPGTDLNCPPPGDENCPVDLSCGNTSSCTHPSSSGCTDANNSCTNAPNETCINQGSTCTNSICTNQEGTTCTDAGCINSSACADREGCEDLTCTNSNIGQGCSDTGAGEGACKDCNCVNQRNCSDGISGQAGNCIDTGGCNNASPATCSDFDKCVDSKCINNLSCSDTQPFVGACKDDFCMNRSCNDAGENSNKCLDSGCINNSISGLSPIGCQDHNCNDNHCMNIFPDKNHCQDDSCVDTGCWNQVLERCKDASNCTDNTACGNFPKGSPNCPSTQFDDGYQTGCVDTGTFCRDSSNPANGCGGLDNQTHCVDQKGTGDTECIDFNNCTNDAFCIDVQDCNDMGCNNSGDKNICHDGSDGNCVDNGCKNDGLCVNVQNLCTDNSCINDECVNFGQTCSNNPTTCTDNDCGGMEV